VENKTRSNFSRAPLISQTSYVTSTTTPSEPPFLLYLYFSFFFTLWKIVDIKLSCRQHRVQPIWLPVKHCIFQSFSVVVSLKSRSISNSFYSYEMFQSHVSYVRARFYTENFAGGFHTKLRGLHIPNLMYSKYVVVEVSKKYGLQDCTIIYHSS